MDINELWNWANNSVDQPVAYDNTPSLYTVLSRVLAKLDETIDTGKTAEWGKVTGDISNQSDLINKISETASTPEWGKVTGDISNQTDLKDTLDLLRYDIDDLTLRKANTTAIDVLNNTIEDINTKLVNINTLLDSAKDTAVWGKVTGNLTDQTDLMTLLTGLRTDVNGLITLTKPKIAPQLTNIAFTMVGAGGANPGYLLLRVDFDENLKVTTDVVLSDVQVQYQQKGATTIALQTVPIAPGKSYVGIKDTFNPVLIPNRYGFGFSGEIPLTTQSLKNYVIQGIGIAFTITVNGQSRRLFSSYNIGRGDL